MKIKIVTLDKKLEKTINKKYKSKNPDIIIPIGGDGTFIYAIQSNKDTINRAIPFYGIANGTLNFLMNKYEYNNVNRLLKHISKKTNIEFIKTPILKYYINNKYKGIAVNEVVYGESIRAYPIINLSFENFNETFQGSMIAISSPVGSTGLNKNIKGRIIPKLEYPLMNINSIASSIDIHKTIEDGKVSITQLHNRGKVPILVDNIVVDYMNDNDILRVELGDYISIGFDNIDEFEKKRVLSTII